MKGWLNLFFVSLLLQLCRHVQGAVTLSSSEIAEVCVGDDLEFTCNITGIVLEWIFPKLMSQRQFAKGIVAQGPAEDQTSKLTDNNITYRFTRTSAEGCPVSSTLTVSPVSDGHNGTDITCVDVGSPTSESSSTTIIIIGSQIQDPEVNKTEEFGNDGVTVTLKWAQENSYKIAITPYLPFTFTGSTNAQIKVQYNALYNVSVLGIPPICGQIDSVFELYYASCENIVNQTDESIIVHGYMNPAVEGASVTFSCPPGLVLTGPNTSTCFMDGEWEPDPQHIKCLARCNPPLPPSNGQLLPYTSTLEGATVVYVCWSIHKRGQCTCEEMKVIVVCNKQGHWEPSTEDICAESRGSFLSEGGKIAVASVSIFFITSIVFFTFGYFCRHYRQKQTQTPPISVIKRTPVYENVIPQQNVEQDLELKENVAYGPITTVS